jgi:hypothetical protein
MPVTVLLGWDRPLGHYFLVIENDRADDYLYSNLNEPYPFDKSLDYYQSKLREFGISVPEVMFEQIKLDVAFNVGNRLVWYEADGSFKDH